MNATKQETIAINKILQWAAIIMPLLATISYIVTYTATITRIDQQVSSLKESVTLSISRLDGTISKMNDNDKIQDKLIQEAITGIKALEHRIDLLQRNGLTTPGQNGYIQR